MTDDDVAVRGISKGTEDTMNMSKIDILSFFSFEKSTNCWIDGLDRCLKLPLAHFVNFVITSVHFASSS